jgi:acetyl esterase
VLKPDVDEVALDANLQLLLKLGRAVGHTGFETLGSVERARREYRLLSEHVLGLPTPAPGPIEDVQIPGPDGLIAARVYHPSADAALTAAIVYFHGGGFVIGDLHTHEHLCRHIAARTGARVIAVDYRLAPEHVAPAAVEDCEAATRWVMANAGALRVDPARIALAGDSAGGNLAAVVSQRIPGIAAQLLLYPTVDAAADTPSKARFASGYGLDRSTVDWFRATYVAALDLRDPVVSPLHSPELRRSPPTVLALAGFDVLRDEGREFHAALRRAGVPVELLTFGALIHGFAQMTRHLPSRVALDTALDRLAARLR